MRETHETSAGGSGLKGKVPFGLNRTKGKVPLFFFGKVPSKLVKISRNLSNSLRNLSFSNKEPFLCCSSDLKEPFLCCKGNIPSCARPNGCMGIEGEIFNLCIIRRQNVEGEWLPGQIDTQ